MSEFASTVNGRAVRGEHWAGRLWASRWAFTIFSGNSPMNHRNRALGLSALAIASAVLMVAARFFQPALTPLTFWVVAWAGFESLAAFYGLSWSMGRSNRAFFSVFGAGALVRLGSIGVVALIVTWMRVSPVAPLLSLVFSYFFLSLIQIPFISSPSALRSHGLR
jgi:hypothetical protein